MNSILAHMLCTCFSNNKNKMKAISDSTAITTLEICVVIYNNFDQVY